MPADISFSVPAKSPGYSPEIDTVELRETKDTLKAVPNEELSTDISVDPVSSTGKPKLPEMNLDKGIVGWDSQEDPSMPLNFSQNRKWALLAQITAITFVSPLSSTIFAPGATFMDKDFHNSNSLLSSFTVSVYILGYVLGPLFIAPASECWGRRPVLSATNWWYVIWQAGCAVAPNIGCLIAFRFLAGLGGAGCMTLNGGIIADLFVPEERGAANALAAIGVIFGPVIGPIFGAFIGQRAGWRWIFWVLCCLSGVITIVIQIFNKESYAPVIIARKTAKLSKELGRKDLRSCYDVDEVETKPEKFQREFTRPLRMLFLSPVIALFCTYMSLVYGLLYLLLTTLPMVYTETYHWSTELTGLASLGIGIGFFVGLVVIGLTSDKIIVKLTNWNGGIYEPEMRLPYMTLFAILIPISFFWYGWAADKAVHWIVPIIALSPFGFGMLGIFFPIQMYLIDAFPVHSASAMAALTVSRSLVGALLPMAGPQLYSSLGLGWGNSLLGFIALLMVPMPYYLWKYGGTIRKRHVIKL
ncbi:hypothetical protein BTUL_0078g00510 [Botrytis tulipae]|uniref:Major facilitator superfamily (MFS) profile domain-containing protein n=1 Tax=Botrytis tulipae TaxID=87230 RepID=A0A4Z1EQM7_9HELO|nr:hypothetical protein BTUL_0078g00510 [Botrytis tulipae]